MTEQDWQETASRKILLPKLRVFVIDGNAETRQRVVDELRSYRGSVEFVHGHASVAAANPRVRVDEVNTIIIDICSEPLDETVSFVKYVRKSCPTLGSFCM